ncbi:hypothetical protein GCM10027592_22070 [Spirosoma flavus]
MERWAVEPDENKNSPIQGYLRDIDNMNWCLNTDAIIALFFSGSIADVGFCKLRPYAISARNRFNLN